MKLIIKFIISGLIFFLVNCSSKDAQDTKDVKSTSGQGISIKDTLTKPGDNEKVTFGPEPAEADNQSEKKIMFFLNPNGRPCQIQDEIIQGLSDQITGKASVVYVKTTTPSDRDKFYKYGVRSLPLLIILNADGSEHMRFPPGIQQPGDILGSLD